MGPHAQEKPASTDDYRKGRRSQERQTITGKADDHWKGRRSLERQTITGKADDHWKGRRSLGRQTITGKDVRPLLERVREAWKRVCERPL